MEESQDGTVTDHAAAVTSREVVLAALAHLTARERAVILLRYQQDLTEAAAAQELGVAIGAIKSTTARALAKLRLSPHLADHPARRQSRTTGPPRSNCATRWPSTTLYHRCRPGRSLPGCAASAV